MDEKLIRDALGSPVPQYFVEDKTAYAVKTLDGRIVLSGDINFGKTKLLRDKYGSVLPQLWDAENNKWVLATSQNVGGGGAEVGEVKKQLDTVKTQLADITTQSIHKTISKMAKGEVVKIVACGDSITFGQNGANAGVQVTESERYPNELQQILRAVYNNPNITVINEGQPGWSSATWSAVNGRDFKSKVINAAPDAVIIMLGINDVHADLPRDTYRNNLDYLIGLAKSAGIEIILMSPTPTLQKTESSVASVKQINMQIMEYAQIAKSLAESKNVFFVDIQQEFLDLFYKHNVFKPTDIINADFTHLNSYKLIANVIIKNLMASSSLQITGEQKIMAVGSPYVYTNITKNDGVLNYPGVSDYERNYYMFSNGTKYMKFRFNVLKKNMNLKIRYNLSKANGQVGVFDNGVKVYDLLQHNGDNATGSMVLHSVATTVIENLSVGFHEILIDVTNATAVGTVTVPFQIVVEAFEFEENIDRELTRKKTVMSTMSTTYKETFGDIEVKNNKKLLIEYDGTLVEGMEFFTPGLRRDATTWIIPTVISVTTGKLRLLDRTLWTGEQTVTLGTTAIDFTKKHNLKIFVDSAKKYTIYLDGIKEIEAVATRNTIRSGKLMINYVNNVTDTIIDIDNLYVKYI